MSFWRIRELIREFPGTCEIEANEVYSVPLTIGPASPYTLFITLPTPTPEPHNPPLLFCDPVIPHHPMIDPDGKVKLDSVMMGNDGDLVRIVNQIIINSEVNLHNNSVSSAPVCATANLSNGLKLNVSLINSLAQDQVTNLLKDEEKFTKFMTNFQDALEEQVGFIGELKRESRNKALSNIELKKEINALALKLDETHQKYSQTCQSFQNFVALNSSHLSSLNPENILNQIQVNIMELNESTNNSIKRAIHAENYDNLDLELKECVRLRKEYHKKAILLQKYQK